MTDHSARYRGEVAERYDTDRVGRKWEIEQSVMSRLLDEVPADSTILDVPFGTGRYLPFYTRRGHRVIGLDVSLDMLSRARLADSEAVATAIRGDVMAIPLRDKAVDYVVSTRLLNWLSSPDLNRALAEISRVATRGAIIGIREVERVTMDQARAVWTEIFLAPRQSLRRLLRPLRRRGIILHPATTVRAAFRAAGLDVARSELIDEGTAFSRRLFHYTPLRTYLLRKV